MEINQVKQDMANGVIVCRLTQQRLVAASLMLQQSLEVLASSTKEPNAAEYATAVLAKVEGL